MASVVHPALMLRQAQHEDIFLSFILILTLSLSKGDAT